MMSTAPKRLKATTNSQKSGRILIVRSARMASMPVDKIAVGSVGSEASGQIGTDDAREDEDEPEEAKAVERSDGAVRLDAVHRLEPGQGVHADA